jgi:hypothetical protein
MSGVAEEVRRIEPQRYAEDTQRTRRGIADPDSVARCAAVKPDFRFSSAYPLRVLCAPLRSMALAILPR